MREFNEFLEFGLYELADDLACFGKRMCIGEDEMKNLQCGDGDDTSQDSS